jgi:hypothetical protein
MKIASTVVGYKPKALFNPEPDSIEKALILIDVKTKSFQEEFTDLQNGLELITKFVE